MNIVSAQDIKRRGMVAIEEALEQGPARILKYNRPAAVVLSEQDYQQLLAQQVSAPTAGVRDWLAKYSPRPDGQSRAELDASLAATRRDWDEA